MLPIYPARTLRSLGGRLRSLDEASWRPVLAAVISLIMVLPTTMGALLSLPQEDVVLELGWEGVVRQSMPNSCGPAVIATLLRRRGQEVSDLEVATDSHLQPGGQSLADFARVAAWNGLHGSWFSVGREGEAGTLPLPAVVHLRGPNGHFAVLEREFNGYVQLADPARGRILVSADRFEREWTGRTFIFDPSVDLPAAES